MSVEDRRRWLERRLYIPGHGHPLRSDATPEEWCLRAEYLEEIASAYGASNEEAERSRATAALLESQGVRSVRELRGLRSSEQIDDA